MNSVNTQRRVRKAIPELPDPYDHAQAKVFAAMLTAEIDTISTRVDRAEQFALKAIRVGQDTARISHDDEARAQRRVLYELHRQLDALRGRFPDAVDDIGH
ncbi:hypothetical protein [Rhodococcus sp. 077-4]|uniref:hypothetical protein n=1 Tax=Rhodococcus sp. 077-4 TaxID=2789271 RepID=UPI0039F6295F